MTKIRRPVLNGLTAPPHSATLKKRWAPDTRRLPRSAALTHCRPLQTRAIRISGAAAFSNVRQLRRYKASVPIPGEIASGAATAHRLLVQEEHTRKQTRAWGGRFAE